MQLIGDDVGTFKEAVGMGRESAYFRLIVPKGGAASPTLAAGVRKIKEETAGDHEVSISRIRLPRLCSRGAASATDYRFLQQNEEAPGKHHWTFPAESKLRAAAMPALQEFLVYALATPRGTAYLPDIDPDFDFVADDLVGRVVSWLDFPWSTAIVAGGTRGLPGQVRRGAAPVQATAPCVEKPFPNKNEGMAVSLGTRRPRTRQAGQRLWPRRLSTGSLGSASCTTQGLTLSWKRAMRNPSEWRQKAQDQYAQSSTQRPVSAALLHVGLCAGHALQHAECYARADPSSRAVVPQAFGSPCATRRCHGGTTGRRC